MINTGLFVASAPDIAGTASGFGTPGASGMFGAINAISTIFMQGLLSTPGTLRAIYMSITYMCIRSLYAKVLLSYQKKSELFDIYHK